MLLAGGRASGSGEQAARHQEIAEAGLAGSGPPAVGATVSHRTTDDNRLGADRERELDHRLVDDLEAVEEVLRVEASRDVVAVDGRLDRLARLSLVTGAGVEGQRAVGEGELDGG